MKVLILINKIRYWLLASIIFTYTLIFIGGFVRVTESGMGCPDWPKCFDKWYPPLDKSELPDDCKKYYKETAFIRASIDQEYFICEDDFSISKAWTEYFNRLFGAITGIVIFITFLYLFKLRKTHKPAVYLGGAALILTGIEGLIGKEVVESHLEGNMITIHLIIALIIISLLIMSYSMIIKSDVIRKSNYSSDQINIIKWIFIVMILGIILGTQIRHSIEDSMSFVMIGRVHSFLGFTLLMLAGLLWNKIRKKKSEINTTEKR